MGVSQSVGTARRRILTYLGEGSASAARWHGCLAYIADALGEEPTFSRLYATYLDLPRRPMSLDALLSEAVARWQKK